MPTKNVTPAPVAEGQIPMFPDDEPAFTEAHYQALSDEEKAVVGRPEDYETTALTVAPPTHHLVVGMGTLAALSEDEFQAKLALMQQGQDRIRTIMEKLLIKGEDYGIVKGIERPFLHQPGAEKLANFYGLAARQEAERITGDGITEPPLAYHVKTYVHLGDFSGPAVAMGYGEASSWEEKYRYRWGKATCPKCGREGLIRGKADGKLRGKWWCPGREGGCNSTFEAADPTVTPPGKIENTDPYSLAETLIQMAGKRSFVAAIRRATGTSGLFTQDDDSPSVQQQVADIPQDDPSPVVEAGPEVTVAVGGKTEMASSEQLARLVSLAKEKGVDKDALSALFLRLFGSTVEPSSPAISNAARGLTGAQIGQMLWTMETGEVDPLEASKASGVTLKADGMPV